MLKTLEIGFKSPSWLPDQKPPPWLPDQKSRLLPLPTRTLLPVLTELKFSGAREYLEDLVARIDAPLLDNLAIAFFPDPILHTSYSSQVAQFITRAPKFKARDEARVFFTAWDVSVIIPQAHGRALRLSSRLEWIHWKLSSLARFCESCFPQALTTAVKHLYILADTDSFRDWKYDIKDSEWPLLLHPFTGVKDLYISLEFSPLVASALEELDEERVTEVLPALQTLFLEELRTSRYATTSRYVRPNIREFVAARQLANHPISISGWERKEV
jgi:hypothetical protein